MGQGPIFYGLGKSNGGVEIYPSQAFSDGELYRIEARGIPPATDPLGAVTTFIGRLPNPEDFYGTNMYAPHPLPNNLFDPAPGTPFNSDPAVLKFHYGWDGVAFTNGRICVSQVSQYQFKSGSSAFPHGTNLFSVANDAHDVGGTYGQIFMPPQDPSGAATNGLQYEGTLPFTADMAKLCTSPAGDFIFVAAGNCGSFYMDPTDGTVSAVNSAGLVPRLAAATDVHNGLFRFCLSGPNAGKTYFVGQLDGAVKTSTSFTGELNVFQGAIAFEPNNSNLYARAIFDLGGVIDEWTCVVWNDTSQDLFTGFDMDLLFDPVTLSWTPGGFAFDKAPTAPALTSNFWCVDTGNSKVLCAAGTNPAGPFNYSEVPTNNPVICGYGALTFAEM